MSTFSELISCITQNIPIYVKSLDGQKSSYLRKETRITAGPGEAMPGKRITEMETSFQTCPQIPPLPKLIRDADVSLFLAAKEFA